MKIGALFVGCCLLAGCSKSNIMSSSEYTSVAVGSEVMSLKSLYGEPSTISKLDNGYEIYEYIQRVSLNRETVEMRRYYFLIKDGKIINKKISSEVKDPEDINDGEFFPGQEN